MANSTTNLDIIATSQAQKEVTANALFDALSPATLFGRHAQACTGLTWGYYGGNISVVGVVTQIANGVITLAASNTNYVEATSAGVVSSNTSGFTTGRTRLYTVITGASTVSSYTDWRLSSNGGSGGGGTEPVNAQTGTSYAILDADSTKLVTFSNASAIAVTIAQAGTASVFAAGWFADLVNLGAGTVTLTPTTSTVNGGTTIQLKTGQSIRLVSDGTNYQVCARTSRPKLDIITDSTTARTLAITDQEGYIRMTNAAANTVTVPANATVAFDVGTIINIRQAGAGTTTIAAAGGVTINSGLLNLNGQNATASLVKVATNTWDLFGNLV